MDKSFNKDFTPVIKKIFELTELTHQLRQGFEFTKNDEYEKKRQAFIAYWRELEKKTK